MAKGKIYKNGKNRQQSLENFNFENTYNPDDWQHSKMALKKEKVFWIHFCTDMFYCKYFSHIIIVQLCNIVKYFRCVYK